MFERFYRRSRSLGGTVLIFWGHNTVFLFTLLPIQSHCYNPTSVRIRKKLGNLGTPD